jgi:2'-5' RNA ligase
VAPRRRLGVALVLDAPLAHEVDGLRRALGDGALGRIAPHITLVPPVNVRSGDLAEALAVLRRGAQACGRPLTLTLGPPSSFLPDNPVVHLRVGGDLDELSRLRDAVFSGPLKRSLSWPWVPHVTLADDVDPLAVDAALTALSHYRAVAVIDRVVVLEERRGEVGRRWEPLADAALAPAVVVGRGGLELTLVRGRVLDPAAEALLAEALLADGLPDEGLPDEGRPAGTPAAATPTGGAPAGAPAGGAPLAEVVLAEAGRWSTDGRDPIVITGLVDQAVTGVAVAWRSDAGARIAVVVSPARRGSGLGRQLLVHAEDAVRTAGWDCPVLVASGPAGFYRACSRWSVPVGP